MNEAEKASGYGGTDWMSRDVVQIWQAIENQDGAANYELLTGWQRSHELVWQHLRQVQNYRENLAAAWPPAKSPAAAAYIERLDNLVAHLTDTYNAAVTNHQVLYSATLAISQARTSVQAIYHEYASNQAKLEEYRTRPAFVGRYAIPTPQPVPDGRQEELNNRARSIMYGLSNELLQARGQITNPPPYDPALSITDTKTKVPSGHKSHSIPHSASGVSDFNSRPAYETAIQVPITASGGPESSLPPSNDLRHPGLVLSGLAPPAAAMVPTTGFVPTPPVAAISAGLPTSGVAPTLLPPIMANPPGLPPKGHASNLPKDPISQPVTEPIKTGASHVMSPGGVIGGTQPMRGGQATGRRRPQRVNPIGGLINSSESVSSHGASARSTSSSSPQTPWTGTRQGGRPDELEDQQLWDPNNPWETADGVDPVVLPAREQDVDPGPAIGLR